MPSGQPGDDPPRLSPLPGRGTTLAARPPGQYTAIPTLSPPPVDSAGRAAISLEGAGLGRNYYHLHLVSDSTGETLLTVSRAVTTQYIGVASIEHVYPLVRTRAQLRRVIDEIEQAPGIVLYTLVEPELSAELEQACTAAGCPSLSILAPVHALLEAYLGAPSSHKPGAQHVLNAEYFRRIDALNYTMVHDDGQHANDLNDADVVLVGVSRTSKTPTSIYLANRGIKTANVPLVPGVPPPAVLFTLVKPLVVGLVASPDRILQIRQNRLLSLKADSETSYVDRDAVAEEITQSRRLFARHGWPVIDVTRRSIEETAAAIVELHRQHTLAMVAQ